MILVTGATGLVGAHLLHQLLLRNPNQKIKAIYRTEQKINEVNQWLLSKNKNFSSNQIIWEKACINNIPELENAFNNITHVYHCAAVVNFETNNTATLNKINIEGTANMVNLALHHNITKFCYVSSIATLGDANKDGIINEDCDWNPEKNNGDYAISKNGGEIEVWRAIAEGLNAVIVNPGVILGDGFWHNGSGELFTKIYNGFPFYTKGTTGFIAVTDVVLCMIKLMDSDINSQRFVLTESSPTFESVFKNIAKGLNKPEPKFYVSPIITSIFWRIDSFISLLTGKKRTLTKFTAKAAHSTTIYSNNKIKQAIQHQFIPINQYITQIAPLYKTKSQL